MNWIRLLTGEFVVVQQSTQNEGVRNMLEKDISRSNVLCCNHKHEEAENRLLHAFKFEYNIHKNSNVAEEKGYVYIITGEKL